VFDRSPKNLQLTPFGELLLRHAEKIVSGTVLLENEIAQFSSMEAGHLCFGIGPYPAEGIFGKAIALFNKQFSKIHLQVIVDNWQNLYSLLIDEKIEFFIAEISELVGKNNIDITPYKQHQGFLYCNSEHPILNKKSVTLEDCLKYTLIRPKLTKRFTKFLEDDITIPVKDNQGSIIRCDNVSLIKQIISNSDALGIGTYGIIGEQLKNEKFKIVPYKQSFLTTNYGFIKIKNHTLSPAAKKLAFIFDTIERQHCKDEKAFFDQYVL
jgi:DNA-binding transcriptional LysR family regulator